ncbi:MAG: hypothetical protein RIT81_07520 [Deltaproteobacteria bacterium]
MVSEKHDEITSRSHEANEALAIGVADHVAPSLAQPRTISAGFWICGGVGLAAVVTASVLGGKTVARAEEPDLAHACRLATGANVAWSAAGMAAIATMSFLSFD